jgi:hypothetical protein
MTEAVQENTEPLQPFACDGRIGEEKLFELLAVGGEYPALDFKRELDLNNSGKKLDFIKDCAAMMNLPRGGYLIVGAEDNGTPARYVDALSKEMFDSARLTQTVKGYVDGAVDIRSQVHNVEIQKTSASFALIYVAPPADGIPAIMFKNGVVAGEKGIKPIFYQGMVFTREGTTNALVRHQTWSQVLHNLRERQRIESRADVDALVHRVVQLMGASATSGPVAPDLAMDSASFIDAVRATLDAEKHPVIKRFLVQAKGTYRAAGTDDEARSHVLNRIAAVACEAVHTTDLKTVTDAVDTLFELYKSHLDAPTGTSGQRGAAARWLEIILRVLNIGAMTVRAGMLEAVPTLVLRQIGDATYSYPSWIRHALTMASRGNLLPGSNGATRGGGLIALSSEILIKFPELRPDWPLEVDDDPLADTLLDSLCQFDLLWCCLALSASERKSSAAFYPSCAAFHQQRAMPIVAAVDGDGAARHAVFANIDDEVVATSIVQVLESAREQSWGLGGFWSGARDLPSRGFVMSRAAPEVLEHL